MVSMDITDRTGSPSGFRRSDEHVEAGTQGCGLTLELYTQCGCVWITESGSKASAEDRGVHARDKIY